MNRLSFYKSAPHECSYLPSHQAANVFADPRVPLDTATYTRLAELGFRRSGEYVYRPHCTGCADCVATRVPAARFIPDRTQRRTWQRNRDLESRILDPMFRSDHFALYKRYLHERHRGGGMDDPTPQSYLGFLTSSWSESWLVEFRLQGELLCVACVDRLLRGLSSVYTFFDPAHEKRGLGTYAILWQIAQVRRLAMEYLYLGYWIADCRKMRYKEQFRPIEGLVDGLWQPLRSGTNQVSSHDA